MKVQLIVFMRHNYSDTHILMLTAIDNLFETKKIKKIEQDAEG